MTASSDPASARFLIGIDLGTTNSAVAFVDTSETRWTVHDFAIAQLVAAGEVEARQALPSFLYEAAAGEFAPGALRLPWGTGASGHVDGMTANPKDAVGYFARDHGAAVPGRLVVSAKSWLSHSGVDRTAPLLPWHAAADVEKLSPVDASARYLGHIRAAWDHAHPGHPLAGQDVVLTVPASFDEVARELTVQAARLAGLVKVVLVEEPQAAFYAWIHSQGADWDRSVQVGQTILVCDVGGGTSDFTLIRVRPAAGTAGVANGEATVGAAADATAASGAAGAGKVLFHRVAVGEHLILGGDNLDLALAHYVEKKLSGDVRLPPHQWGPLVRTCRQAKETLLGADPPERMTINLAGGGSKLIGSSRSVELTQDEARRVLVDGFLPFVPPDAGPTARRSGFQEFGLPYASDPAITRYLAAFLAAHQEAPPDTQARPAPNPAPVRPDWVLFNGGLFESPLLRQRLLDVMGSWFECAGAGGKRASSVSRDGTPSRAAGDAGVAPAEVSGLSAGAGGSAARTGDAGVAPSGVGGLSGPPRVLRNDRLDLAVARGAAYYGMVRRGRGVRITGGLAHSYYVGVQTGRGDEVAAVCVLPAGVEEGQAVDLIDRTFDLLIRQPAEFPLYYSATRTTDAPGQLLTVDPEQLTPLPPIRTVLQSGRRVGADVVPVHLHARLTEIGTLEMWCGEARGERRWKLQFDVRAATRADAAQHGGAAEAEGFVEEATVAECRDFIRAAFHNPDGAGDPPARLVKRLEAATAMTRHEWPGSLMRAFWETLIVVEPGRRLSVDHEARWLSLTGFCLRPGYGLAVDDWRVAQLWKLYPAGVYFPKNELCRAEWWILWRRVAGGLTPGQQATLADPLIADWRTYARKSGSGVKGRSATFQFGPHESAEVWRLLGSLELLKPAAKAELGDMQLDRLLREKVAAIRDANLFALGRLGQRISVYGPLNMLVAAELAERWTGRLIELNPPDDRATFAAVQLTRRTGDRYRDVSDAVRQSALQWLTARAAPPHLLELVREGGQLRDEEQRTVFGESLPAGLRIE